MAKAIDPAMLDLMKSEMATIPRGGRVAKMAQWAELLDVHVSTLYGALPATRVRTGTRSIAGIEEAALIVAMIKNRPPEHRGQIATKDAVKIAVGNGLVPLGMACDGTFDRVIRDLGANQQRRRVERYQAEYPNQMHHLDASSSNCFYVHHELSDGDYMLRIYGGTKDYKNKPVPIRLRPWIYGVADDTGGNRDA